MVKKKMAIRGSVADNRGQDFHDEREAIVESSERDAGDSAIRKVCPQVLIGLFG
jgi:hypothetical protein